MFDAQKNQVDLLNNLGEGDSESGIEAGLRGIEVIDFMEVFVSDLGGGSGEGGEDNRAEWKVEWEDMRVLEEGVKWLRSRGFGEETREEVERGYGGGGGGEGGEIEELREAEKEVLESIYGEEIFKVEEEVRRRECEERSGKH